MLFQYHIKKFTNHYVRNISNKFLSNKKIKEGCIYYKKVGQIILRGGDNNEKC